MRGFFQGFLSISKRSLRGRGGVHQNKDRLRRLESRPCQESRQTFLHRQSGDSFAVTQVLQHEEGNSRGLPLRVGRGWAGSPMTIPIGSCRKVAKDDLGEACRPDWQGYKICHRRLELSP